MMRMAQVPIITAARPRLETNPLLERSDSEVERPHPNQSEQIDERTLLSPVHRSWVADPSKIPPLRYRFGRDEEIVPG